MKIAIVAVILGVSLCYVTANPCAQYPPCVPVPVAVPTCLNPKVALYQKYPLIYKLRSHFCKLVCDPLKGLHCPPVPDCVTPAPVVPWLAFKAPKLVPPPRVILPCPVPVAPHWTAPAAVPVCPAPAPSVTPELLNTLFAFTQGSACPETPLEPALSCACA